MQDGPNDQSVKVNKLVHTCVEVFIAYCLTPGPLIYLFVVPFLRLLFYPHEGRVDRFYGKEIE